MYIILGKSGYIAEAIISELSHRKLEFKALSRNDIDYTNKKELSLYLSQNFYRKTVANHNITIVNCAGFIGKPNVDACEKHKAECINGNILLPSMLAQLCAENGYKFVHISSGCIYNGYEKIFTEEDEPNFDFNNGSFYSGTKALAEKTVLQHCPESFIFRLRIPFDQYASSRNYITKLLSYERLVSFENSLTNRFDFAKYALDLLSINAEPGIYNITNKGSISAEEVIDLTKTYCYSMQKFLKSKQFSFFSNLDQFMLEITAPRSNCVLDTSKIESLIKVRDVRTALIESLKNYT